MGRCARAPARRPHRWMGRLGRGVCLLLAFICLGLAAPSRAAAPSATEPGQPAKVRELLDLLADPQVRDWIKAQAAPKAAAAAPQSPQAELQGRFSARLGAIRAHLAGLAAAVPRLPAQFAGALQALNEERQGRSPLAVPLYLAVFLGARPGGRAAVPVGDTAAAALGPRACDGRGRTAPRRARRVARLSRHRGGLRPRQPVVPHFEISGA
jgi:hypothetical protein